MEKFTYGIYGGPIWQEESDGAYIRALEAREQAALATLRSIVNNSCCGRCQEAKAVAQAALALIWGEYDV